MHPTPLCVAWTPYQVGPYQPATSQTSGGPSQTYPWWITTSRVIPPSHSSPPPLLTIQSTPQTPPTIYQFLINKITIFPPRLVFKCTKLLAVVVVTTAVLVLAITFPQVVAVVVATLWITRPCFLRPSRSVRTWPKILWIGFTRSWIRAPTSPTPQSWTTPCFGRTPMPKLIC